jgi:hypothetical protein
MDRAFGATEHVNSLPRGGYQNRYNALGTRSNQYAKYDSDDATFPRVQSVTKKHVSMPNGEVDYGNSVP